MSKQYIHNGNRTQDPEDMDACELQRYLTEVFPISVDDEEYDDDTQKIVSDYARQV